MIDSAQSKAISVVIATHNRRDVVLNTLGRVRTISQSLGSVEIIVVDNASTDGTGVAVRGAADKVIQLRRNLGSCAKAIGVEHARGRYIVFLDDDSYPRSGSLERMIRRFEDQPRLAAAGFSVVLPDGSPEASALPSVFVGCGVGLRTQALRQVGNLDASFFMQAEEFDLCFRLVNAGWEIGVFKDLVVDHLKTPAARRSERTTFYDIRNNIRILARYLPPSVCDVYFDDWLTRYRWFAENDNLGSAFLRGVRAGTICAIMDRIQYRNHRLTEKAFEQFFCWQYIAEKMKTLASLGIRRIVLAGFGKNVFAFHRGATLAGLTIDAIADDRIAQRGRRYRNVEIMTLKDAFYREPDAVVVSSMAGALAEVDEWQVRQRWDGKVYRWFGVEGRRDTAVVEQAATAIRFNIAEHQENNDRYLETTHA